MILPLLLASFLSDWLQQKQKKQTHAGTLLFLVSISFVAPRRAECHARYEQWCQTYQAASLSLVMLGSTFPAGTGFFLPPSHCYAFRLFPNILFGSILITPCWQVSLQSSYGGINPCFFLLHSGICIHPIFYSSAERIKLNPTKLDAYKLCFMRREK